MATSTKKNETNQFDDQYKWTITSHHNYTLYIRFNSTEYLEKERKRKYLCVRAFLPYSSIYSFPFCVRHCQMIIKLRKKTAPMRIIFRANHFCCTEFNVERWNRLTEWFELRNPHTNIRSVSFSVGCMVCCALSVSAQQHFINVKIHIMGGMQWIAWCVWLP